MDDFLAKKYQWLFSFFDLNNDGTLEREDFTARAQRASEAVYNHFNNVPDGQQLMEKHYERIKEAQLYAYNQLFDMLIKAIDSSNDRQISQNEWNAFCVLLKQSVDQTGKLPKWFEDLLVYYFTNVLDFNGNGKIDFYEMTFMGDAPPEVTWYCYDKLTNQNQLPLDLTMFLDKTKDYMSTTDPNSNSRYMYGFVEGAETS